MIVDLDSLLVCGYTDDLEMAGDEKREYLKINHQQKRSSAFIRMGEVLRMFRNICS